jgi:type II secretory pathway pseudopilin PulG
MSGSRVLIAVLSSGLATAVLPPAVAWTVNRRRIDRARADVTTLADWIRSHRGALEPVAGSVLCGPGTMPVANREQMRAWIQAPHATIASVQADDAVHADPWGNCYLVDVPQAPADIHILSAGANGTIETPIRSAHTEGDDVSAMVRAGNWR